MCNFVKQLKSVRFVYRVVQQRGILAILISREAAGTGVSEKQALCSRLSADVRTHVVSAELGGLYEPCGSREDYFLVGAIQSAVEMCY